MTAQTISASYIADLIEMNEQALVSLKKREDETDADPTNNMAEWGIVISAGAWGDNYLETLRKYHAFLVAKEDAEHRAERLTKSTIGL